SAANDSDTDDSGQSVAEATDTAAAPSRFKFGSDGTIMAANEQEPMEFENFPASGPRPGWTFTSDGETIIAKGEKYPDRDDNANSETSGDADSKTDDPDGSANDSHTAGDTAESDSDSDSTSSANSNADGSRADSDSGSGSDSNSSSDSGSAARGDTSDDSDTSSDSVASKDSGSNDRA